MTLRSSVKIGFVDDVTLSGDLQTVEQDIITIASSHTVTGLRLNTAKCDITMDDFTNIDTIDTFKDFIRVPKDDMTLLGAPVVSGNAQDTAIMSKIDDLSRAIDRLKLLHAHDALFILKNSIAIPKLLHLLRTSECGNNQLLRKSDDTLRSGLSTILNVYLSEDQWLQASLPVRDRGLGIRSAQMLAPSAFLASAASTLQLQQFILPYTISSLEDASVESIEALWVNVTDLPEPDAEERHIHKAWDGQVTKHNRELILSRASTDIDKARLRAASSPHFGDWLHAPPISTVGLRLSDEAIREAVAHRLGCRACEPHTCVCGKAVDARGLNGLSCRKSAPRQQRYSHMNDIIFRAIKREQVPAINKPVSFMWGDNKRPDGTTLLPGPGEIFGMGRDSTRHLFGVTPGQHCGHTWRCSQPSCTTENRQVL